MGEFSETVILVMNFQKKGGGGGVISDLLLVQPVCGKNCNIFSKKKGGRGQRPFEKFPEIHPFLKRRASLREQCKIIDKKVIL